MGSDKFGKALRQWNHGDTTTTEWSSGKITHETLCMARDRWHPDGIEDAEEYKARLKARGIDWEEISEPCKDERFK